MKKMLALVVMLLVSLLTSCDITASNENNDGDAQDTDSNAQRVITVVAPKSPATIPVLAMIENQYMGSNTEIDLQIYTNMEAMMVLASSSDYGIMILPAHTAANLKNKDMDVTLMNAFNWGGMSLSTTDPVCNSWKDLEGKELYVPAKGSVPDILTQYFLKRNGLVSGENIEVFYSGHAEIAQMLSEGNIQYAIDAQPFVTLNTKSVQDYKVISNFSEEWKLTQGEEYTMPANCMVARTAYLSENEELVQEFNETFSEAIQWTVDNPTDAATLASEHIKANTELMAEAMPSFCFDYKSVAEAKNDIEQYYTVLLQLKPESIGRNLPDEEFYYVETE